MEDLKLISETPEAFDLHFAQTETKVKNVNSYVNAKF